MKSIRASQDSTLHPPSGAGGWTRNGENFSAVFASSNAIENIKCCFCMYKAEIADAPRARAVQRYKLKKDSTIPCREDINRQRKNMSICNGKVIWNCTEPKPTISEQGKAFTLDIVKIKCDCFITTLQVILYNFPKYYSF